MHDLIKMYQEGKSIRSIAREVGLSRYKVTMALYEEGLYHPDLEGSVACKRCGKDIERSSIPIINLIDGKLQCFDCRKTEQNRFQLRRLGLDETKYRDLLERQKHCCAICGTQVGHMRKGIVCRLAVDHDHETGKIRGLLCGSCNRGLGRFQDSPELLEKAARYLRESQ